MLGRRRTVLGGSQDVSKQSSAGVEEGVEEVERGISELQLLAAA